MEQGDSAIASESQEDILGSISNEGVCAQWWLDSISLLLSEILIC